MNLNIFKNVLVLAPHTDDGELGAGGFIHRLIDSGAHVVYAAFSTAAESVPSVLPSDILKTEVKAATKVLGIKAENLVIFDYAVRKLSYVRQDILEDLIKLRKTREFDLVLMPSLKDIHQDHAVVAQEGLRAFKGTNVWGYELIWNNLSFDTDIFVHLDEKYIDQKIKALAEYQSQKGRPYMTGDFVRSLAHTRGVQIGTKYAECFELIRMVVK